jgi:hypothetical protein
MSGRKVNQPARLPYHDAFRKFFARAVASCENGSKTVDLDDVLTRCRNARFTGVLRVRSREADGEIWLLSGIVDAVRFGADAGDAAKQRMAGATNVAFELVTRLPGIAGGFKTRLDLDGPLGEVTPVALMRYCEVHAITCELDLVFGSATVRASYAEGELRSIESSSPSESVAALLESHEGRYRFALPPAPEGVPVHDPAKSVRPQLGMEHVPDSLTMRAPGESRRATQVEASAKPGDDAELKRKAVDLVAKRKPDEEAEAKRKAEAEAAKRKADEDAAEQRKAAAEAEAKRKADEQAAAAQRNANEEAAVKREPRALAKPKPASAPVPTSAPTPARSATWRVWIIAAIVVAVAIALYEQSR